MRSILLSLALALTVSCGSGNRDAPPLEAAAPAHGVRDPVCGMTVDPKNAVASSEYKGKKYYFCSREDKDRFDKAPAQYLPR